MTIQEEIVQLLNRHLNPTLDNAQLAIASEGQFLLFRKRLLKEFGEDGFQRELLELFERTMEKETVQE